MSGRWPADLPRHFYPRPPRGGRPWTGTIDPTPLRFLSTPSARRATDGWKAVSDSEGISIHALREEGDTAGEAMPLHLQISIHALREEGDTPAAGRPANSRKFLSTPSARRATGPQEKGALNGLISIHALREEGDFVLPDGWEVDGYFYPRPPRGGRPLKLGAQVRQVVISIHALREEGDA